MNLRSRNYNNIDRMKLSSIFIKKQNAQQPACHSRKSMRCIFKASSVIIAVIHVHTLLPFSKCLQACGEQLQRTCSHFWKSAVPGISLRSLPQYLIKAFMKNSMENRQFCITLTTTTIRQKMMDICYRY